MYFHDLSQLTDTVTLVHCDRFPVLTRQMSSPPAPAARPVVGPAPVEAPGNVTTAPVWHGFCNLEAEEVKFSTIGDTAKEFLLEQDGSCRVKKPGQTNTGCPICSEQGVPSALRPGLG